VAEITEFMMVALTFLVLAHIQDRKGHVRISFLIIRLSKRTQLILGIITALCALAVFVLATWAAWAYAFKALKFGFRTDESEFHLFPPRLLVPMGCFLMCFRLLADVGSHWVALWKLKSGDDSEAVGLGSAEGEHIH
jgi:TRAP-type C4-dicarboxylate transport system permease small subunit